MRNIIIIFTLSLIFLNSSYISAEDSIEVGNNISLSGNIKNLTDLDLVQNYTIKLMATQNASSDLIEIESVNTNKLFEFKNIKIESSFTYFLIINHQEMPTVLFLQDIDDLSNIEIEIYQRSYIPENIEVNDYSIMIPYIAPNSNTVSILGLISLTNTGNESFMADLSDPNISGVNLLRFSLPENFQNLSVDSDLPPGNVMQIPTGFALSNPVPPGEHQILYSYSMPQNITEIPFSIRLPFGAKKFKLLAPEKSKYIMPDILSVDFTNVDGKKYVVFSSDEINKGEIVSIDYLKISKPNVISKSYYFIENNTIAVVFGSISALILISLVLFSIVINNKRKKEAKGSSLVLENNEFIEKIINLDSRFDSKEINKEEYEILRESYKNKVKRN